MAPIKCVVVEDDPVARAIISKLIDQHEELILMASFSGAKEAASWFELHRNAELVFMDVDLNGDSGINLYRQLPYRPDIIFITAHEDFAFTAFELGAIDYLKKPVTRERFLRSLERIKKSRAGNAGTPDASEAGVQTLFLKEGKNFVRLRMADILFFEASRDYIKVVTPEKCYMVLMTMKEMMSKLDPAEFLRASKSYIVNKRRVVKMEQGVLYISHHRITVSRKTKQEIKAALGIT